MSKSLYDRALTLAIASYGDDVEIRQTSEIVARAAAFVPFLISGAPDLTPAREEEGEPSGYINGDSGYLWLHCGEPACDEAIIEVEAGDIYAAIVLAMTGHQCSGKKRS